MENLHLKNIQNIPTGYNILKKLQNEIQKNYYIESYELQDEIIKYVKSLNFKNNKIKEYINDFLITLKEDPFGLKIVNRLEVIIRIITLLYKYNINNLDIGDKLDFNKMNNDIIKLNNLQSIKLIEDNTLQSINLIEDNTTNQNSILFLYTLIIYPNSKVSRYIFDTIYITGLNNTITDIRKNNN
jgi:hypothetical protein